jgi:hypothetical protein
MRTTHILRGYGTILWRVLYLYTLTYTGSGKMGCFGIGIPNGRIITHSQSLASQLGNLLRRGHFMILTFKTCPLSSTFFKLLIVSACLFGSFINHMSLLRSFLVSRIFGRPSPQCSCLRFVVRGYSSLGFTSSSDASGTHPSCGFASSGSTRS